jgi:hypothetical protein
LRAAEAARGHSFFHGLHDRLQQLHQCALASATGVAT